MRKVKKMVAAFGGELTEYPGGDIRAKVSYRALTFRGTKPKLSEGPFFGNRQR